jgi:hypothetical protein
VCLRLLPEQATELLVLGNRVIIQIGRDYPGPDGAGTGKG